MILLTGACGFLGKHIVWHVASSNTLEDALLCVDKVENASVLNRFPHLRSCRWEFGDLADRRFVAGLFSAYSITSVVHVAAEVHHINPKLACDRDVRSMRALVEMVTGKAKVPVLFVSSLDVVREKNDPYTSSKRTCEYLLAENVERYCIVRPPLLYGPYDTKNCDVIFRWVLRHSWIPTFGKGNARMTPVFVGDMARTIVTILGERFFSNETFAVAGEDIVTWKEMIDVAAGEFGKSIRRVAVPRLAWAAMLRVYRVVTGRSLINPDLVWTLFQDRVYEGSRLRRGLGLRFCSFDEGMKITCASYMEKCDENLFGRAS